MKVKRLAVPPRLYARLEELAVERLRSEGVKEVEHGWALSAYWFAR